MTDIATLPSKRVCGTCELRTGGDCRFAALSGVRVRHLAKGETLVHEGELPERLFLLRRGYLRMLRFGCDGDRVVMALLAAGDVVPAFPGRALGFSVEAASDTEVCEISGAAFRAAFGRDTALRHRILDNAAAHLRRLQDAIWLRGRLTSRERVIAFLVQATECMPVDRLPDGSLRVTMRVSRGDWADMSDTTVETVSRVVRGLADEGLVETLARHRYRIPDIAGLRLLARLDPVGAQGAPGPAPWQVIGPRGDRSVVRHQ
ncbi:Crp/Fnr family transcriptional regulator [Rhodosalinus sp. 5P4]|uniref:Crp/Fnr family transcriptional regulator n=1 Tax=Rhodosalinus sp. 5P4 TaxID=3239196 RepID=UPI0035265CFF